ncbi:MAG: DUF2802 domain-containing protein [Pseudomonadales bacterium]|nr:DUF2802 domain-containing protein [Pseudomonadales bacterium]MCP5358169.1 DUF2802 domain-containing protein [Pseudomonadales bacterium]
MTPALIISVTFIVMLCGCMLAMSVHVLRKVQRLQERLDNDMRALRGEITAVSRGAVGLGKRVKKVQDTLQDTRRRQEDLENKDMGDVAIIHASKLALMGAPTEELVSTCGLSKAEASLLSLMAARSKAEGRHAA